MTHAEHRWVRGSMSGAWYCGKISYGSYLVLENTDSHMFEVHGPATMFPSGLDGRQVLGTHNTLDEAKRHAEILHAMEA